MSAIKSVNPQADVIGTRHALMMNINAAKGLADVVKSNLGPRGTMKMSTPHNAHTHSLHTSVTQLTSFTHSEMCPLRLCYRLVSGAGLIKVTKDGKVLLDEMQIQHPTAAIIARTATAQEDQTGDGTTSNVLFTGELLGQAERYIAEGLHPRILVDGFELAREETLRFLDSYKTNLTDEQLTRALTIEVARTALRTKLNEELADHMTTIIVDAVTTIHKRQSGSSSGGTQHLNGDSDASAVKLDLHMVEIMTMKHQSALDTRFIDGLVLDHGSRHPDMKTTSDECYIMTLNVSLEYEKSEVNSGFFYATAEERQKLVAAERKYTDDKVNRIIAFKNDLEAKENKVVNLIVINQKGIDPVSLDLLQKAGIVGIRRAKRRNMERLVRACGGYAVNSVDSLELACLGYAAKVYEHTLGDDKYTFIEGCRHPTSCTILVRGPNDHTIRQIQDAVHDGLRAVANLIEDRSIVPGAGAFELAAHLHLHQWKQTVSGRAKIGVQAFADAMLIIPKVLCSNSGLDAQGTLIELLDEVAKGQRVGVDVETGRAMLPEKMGVWDNVRVKKQFLHLGSLIAIKLLLVDEVMRAGRKMGGK